MRKVGRHCQLFSGVLERISPLLHALFETDGGKGYISWTIVDAEAVLRNGVLPQFIEKPSHKMVNASTGLRRARAKARRRSIATRRCDGGATLPENGRKPALRVAVLWDEGCVTPHLKIYKDIVLDLLEETRAALPAPPGRPLNEGKLKRITGG